MLDYTDITKEVVVSHEWSGTANELTTAIGNNEEIIWFVWGFEVPTSRLDELVPEWFPFSTKPKMVEKTLTRENEEWEEEEYTVLVQYEEEDEEWNFIPIVEQKTWWEYWIIADSINDEKLITAIDYISESKCHWWSITSENLYKRVEALWISNIKTKSHFKSLRKIEVEGDI